MWESLIGRFSESKISLTCFRRLTCSIMKMICCIELGCCLCRKRLFCRLLIVHWGLLCGENFVRTGQWHTNLLTSLGFITSIDLEICQVILRRWRLVFILQLTSFRLPNRSCLLLWVYVLWLSGWLLLLSFLLRGTLRRSASHISRAWLTYPLFNLKVAMARSAISGGLLRNFCQCDTTLVGTLLICRGFGLGDVVE